MNIFRSLGWNLFFETPCRAAWLLGMKYYGKKIGSDTVILLNTSYLTDSYIVFTLKLESGQNVCSNRSSIYGQKISSDFPPCGKIVIFITEFVIFHKTPPFYEVK